MGDDQSSERETFAFDPGATDGPPPSTAVVERVASVEGVDPLALSPRLYTCLDPDALDSLIVEHEQRFEVSFDAWGYRITVTGDGRIELAPR